MEDLQDSTIQMLILLSYVPYVQLVRSHFVTCYRRNVYVTEFALGNVEHLHQKSVVRSIHLEEVIITPYVW